MTIIFHLHAVYKYWFWWTRFRKQFNHMLYVVLSGKSRDRSLFGGVVVVSYCAIHTVVLLVVQLENWRKACTIDIFGKHICFMLPFSNLLFHSLTFIRRLSVSLSPARSFLFKKQTSTHKQNAKWYRVLADFISSFLKILFAISYTWQ